MTKFQLRIQRAFAHVWRTKKIWLRAAICGLIGLTVLSFDEDDNYDLRFIARGAQPVSEKIVLINIPEHQIARYSRERLSLIKSYPDFSIEPNYWDQYYWQRLLDRLLEANPQSIMVTLFFDKNLRSTVKEQNQNVFFDDKVYWMARIDDEGKVHRPLFSSDKRVNYGIGNLIYDYDRVVRRFSSSPTDSVPHLTEVVTDRSSPFATAGSSTKIVNFRGAQGTFPTMKAETVLSGNESLAMLKDKIIILGAMQADNQMIQTPLGLMSRAEILANITENIVDGKWIQRLERHWYYLYLLALLVLAVWIMVRYPQTVAAIFLVWIVTATTAFSIWIFDTFNIWLPAFSVAVEIFSVFVLFVSFQLALKERIHWRLTQEARTAQELEQLKNNFVSLFSHDLKTPIAKIQAIVDRMLAQGSLEEHQPDLLSLRKASNELYSYIQKILQVSRVESKKFKLRKDIADLNEIVESVIARMAPLADEKNIRIVFAAEPLFTVDLDSTLIQEVVLNLVDNAIKYSPKGATVKISTSENEDGVEFVIEDQGDGISPDEQLQIWKKFYRASKHDLSTKGSGLGLYLVKYFIELHGGEIELTSEVGKGTTVRFVLPFEIEERADNNSYDLAPIHTEEPAEEYEMRWQ